MEGVQVEKLRRAQSNGALPSWKSGGVNPQERGDRRNVLWLGMFLTPGARTSRRWIRHHLPLFLINIAAVGALYLTRPYPDPITRLSFATAYPALLLLVLTLLLGPWRMLGGARVPVSFDLRRDVGIWAGILSVVHTGFGQMVHLRGRPWLYYVYPPRPHHSFPIRHDVFGFANESGLLATLLVVLLLATSNDISLRRLGAAKWKSLQRFNYALLALTAVHACLYAAGVEKRLKTGWGALILASVGVALLLQVAGIVLRTRYPQGTAGRNAG